MAQSKRGPRALKGAGSKAPRVREKIYLTFPTDLIKEPLIYEVGSRFGVVTNIRRADVSDTMGLVALELDGAQDEVEKAVAWLRERGVQVEPIEKNVIE